MMRSAHHPTASPPGMRLPKPASPPLAHCNHDGRPAPPTQGLRTRLASRLQPPQLTSTGPRPPRASLRLRPPVRFPPLAFFNHRARRPGPRLSTSKHPSLRNTDGRRSPPPPPLLRNGGCGGCPAPFSQLYQSPQAALASRFATPTSPLNQHPQASSVPRFASLNASTLPGAILSFDGGMAPRHDPSVLASLFHADAHVFLPCRAASPLASAPPASPAVHTISVRALGMAGGARSALSPPCRAQMIRPAPSPARVPLRCWPGRQSRCQPASGLPLSTLNS
jgi:hypothetical protein